MVDPIRNGKRAARLLATVTLGICATFAQTPAITGQCAVSAVPPQVRSEGITERIGDLLFQCSNSVPGSVLSGNLTLFFPVSVTNRIDSNNLTHDAVVSIDYGNGFVPTAVPGLVSGRSIVFNSITITVPPSGNYNIKVSNIRVNANQLGFSSGQQAINVSISYNVPLNQAAIPVAYAQTGLFIMESESTITCTGSPLPSTINVSNLFSTGTQFTSTRVTEGFATAFLPKAATEDNGTRFIITYTGFPSNAQLYLPDLVAGSDAAVPTAGGDLGFPQAPGQYVAGSHTLLLARVTGADSNGAGGTPVPIPTAAVPTTLNSASAVPLSNGSGYAVYEVEDANPFAIETAQFPLFIGLASVTANANPSETISIAPISNVTSASQTAPIQRFNPQTPTSDCSILGDCQASYLPTLSVPSGAVQLTATGSMMTGQLGLIQIQNTKGGPMQWTATITYTNGTGWIALDNYSGTAGNLVHVWAKPQGLTPGVYKANILIDAGPFGGQATVPVTLTVSPLPAPTVTVNAVVNAATFAVTPLVPGSLGTIMGVNFGGKDVSVAFDGNAAALLYTGADQINLQVPANLGSKTTSTMVVTVDGVSSMPYQVALSPAWPSIFSHAVLNQDWSVNGDSAPAKAGSVLQIFGTGIPGSAIVTSQIGNRGNLVPLYAGEAPGFSGLQQVNVAIPADMPPGPAQLTICATVGTQQYCSAGYTVAVQ